MKDKTFLVSIRTCRPCSYAFNR